MLVNNKMTPYLSEKIKVMSFLCIILVVWIHTYYLEGTGYTSSMFLMNFWGCGVCLYAVPTFYAISGYLFFMGTKEKDVKAIFSKQKKRVRTLLIPYILTNLLSVLFYFILKNVGTIVPAIDASLNFNLLDKGGDAFLDKMCYWFWNGPIAFQMWFVRDLMILVAFAPVIFYLLKLATANKYTSWASIALCLILVDRHYSAQVWAFAWFALGGVFSMSESVQILDVRRYKWVGLTLFIVSLAIIIEDALNAAGFCAIMVDQDYITITGVPAIWILYDCLSDGIKQPICVSPKLLGSTFFIYLIHEPFLNVFKKIPVMVSRSESMVCISYIIVPIVFVLLSVVVGNLWKSNFPKSYSIFVGGR